VTRRVALAATTLAVAVAAAPATADVFVEVQHTAAGASGPTGGVTAFPDLAATIGAVDILDLSTGHVVVTDRSGSATLDETTEQFWTSAGIAGAPNAFEHRAFYDPVSERFFVTADELTGGANRRYLAVSAGNSAVGPWQAVALAGSAAIRDTRVAVDAASVYLTGDPGDGTTALVVIPLTDALATPPTLAHAVTLSIPEAEAIPALFPQGDTASSEAMLFAARATAPDGDMTIDIYGLFGSGPIAQVRRAGFEDLGQAFPAPPATAAQPSGPDLAVGDGGLRGVVQFGNGDLFGIAETAVDGHAAAVWFAASNTGGGPVAGVLSAADADVLAPSLTVDGDGDIGIAAEQTSTTQPVFGLVAGLASQGYFAGAAPATFPVVGDAAAASCGSAPGVTAFGRTTAISVDPVDGMLFADTMAFQTATPACGFVTALSSFDIADLPNQTGPGLQIPGGCNAGGGAGGAGGGVVAAAMLARVRRSRRSRRRRS
jgi:hypothetical protein